MFTIHLILLVFLLKTSELKIIIGDTLVQKLNETDNSYNDTATFIESGNLNVTTKLDAIQVTTRISSRNNESVKPNKFSGSKGIETDKTYDDYSDFNGDEFTDEKLRLMLYPKKYLTLNRTQLRTVKVNPDPSYVIHGQHAELFLLPALTLNQLHHWNVSNDKNKNESTDISITKSNNVYKKGNFSSIIKQIKVISINESEWGTATNKINTTRENKGANLVSVTEKTIITIPKNVNDYEVATAASIGKIIKTEQNDLKFDQNEVGYETLVIRDQFSTSKSVQGGASQNKNDSYAANDTATIKETNTTTLNHINIGTVQYSEKNSGNQDSISPVMSKSQMTEKIFNDALKKKSKNTIEIGLNAENQSNDNSLNGNINSSLKWDAKTNSIQMLHPAKEIFQEEFIARNSSRFEDADDDFYVELDDEFEFDDENNGNDGDDEEYETENPDGTIVIVLPGDGEKIDLKSSSLKSNVVMYEEISNSLLYLLMNLTVTTTINERNTKNILLQLGHQREQLRVLKNQYDAISNYLVKMTNSKDK